MAQAQKKTRRHRVVHRRLHHDPVKKQEILDKVDAMLKEEPEQEAQSPSGENKPDVVSAPVQPAVSTTTSETVPSVSAVSEEAATGNVKKEEVFQVSKPPAVETPSLTSAEPITPAQTAVPAQQENSSVNASSETVLPETTSMEPAVSQDTPSGSVSEEATPPWRADMAAESASTEGSSWKKKIMTILLFVIIIAASIGGGYMIYSKVLRKESVKTSENASPVGSENKKEQTKASPTLAPSPTNKPVDLTKYSVKVLNGSGVRGTALSVQTLLGTAGFKVTSIGNAKSSDYIKTVIQVKKDIDDTYLAKLKETLSKVYVLSGVQEIPEDETADVVVIIGSTKAE